MITNDTLFLTVILYVYIYIYIYKSELLRQAFYSIYRMLQTPCELGLPVSHCGQLMVKSMTPRAVGGPQAINEDISQPPGSAVGP